MSTLTKEIKMKHEPVAVVGSYQVLCADNMVGPTRTLCTLRELPDEGTKLYSEDVIEHLLSKVNALESVLRQLARDAMASDFNEHWDSFKFAEELLTREEV